MPTPPNIRYESRCLRAAETHMMSLDRAAVEKTWEAQGVVYCPGFKRRILAKSCRERRENLHLLGETRGMCEACIKSKRSEQ
jgi:hypothetical protein